MSNEKTEVAEVTPPAVKLTKAGVPRKKKESKEFRILPGSNTLKKLAENVRKNLSDMMNFEETVAKFMTAFECDRAKAVEMLKAPEGFSDIYNLRKAIRLAVTRPEVSYDGIFLARVALQVAEAIGEDNLIVNRTKGQKAKELAEGITE